MDLNNINRKKRHKNFMIKKFIKIFTIKTIWSFCFLFLFFLLQCDTYVQIKIIQKNNRMKNSKRKLINKKIQFFSFFCNFKTKYKYAKFRVVYFSVLFTRKWDVFLLLDFVGANLTDVLIELPFWIGSNKFGIPKFGKI